MPLSINLAIRKSFQCISEQRQDMQAGFADSGRTGIKHGALRQLDHNGAIFQPRHQTFALMTQGLQPRLKVIGGRFFLRHPGFQLVDGLGSRLTASLL